MKSFLSVFFAALILNISSRAQTNFITTNPPAEQILLGNYDPAAFFATNVINHPDSLSKGIFARVSVDSLKAYLEILRSFENRNTGSDTVSNTKGIGAARRWVHSKFEEFSALNENRLVISYFQFDHPICNLNQHRNILAVLPGRDTSEKSIIIIEAHIDSRCAGPCDSACLAEGMEDNGSGTALVLELARVMSKYSYNHTIVFMPTIGEEQGLWGAHAFAEYASQKGIKIKGVFNNDVIGGIICGQTSSVPSCPGLNNIDSTNVRLFSFGTFNSPHKQLARFIKLEYKEMILPIAPVPMSIQIMTPEDRQNRGGDHIPFRQRGFTAMRFTSANEHGHADVSAAGYSDRQHTSTDILGVDTDSDNILDSFFVDFNYLARNTVINGNAAAMLGIGPKQPDFTLSATGNDVTVQITQQQQYLHYRIGVRSTTNDWDSVYTFAGSTSHTINLPPAIYSISVASVDGNGVESLFSKELSVNLTGVDGLFLAEDEVELLQNHPNPFDEVTTISVFVGEHKTYRNACIYITDALSGKEVKRLPIQLRKGMNEVMYEHGYHASGTFVYTLVIDGKAVQSRKMTFIN